MKEKLFSAINNTSKREPPDNVAPNPTNEATNHALEISKQKEDKSLYNGVSCATNLYGMYFLTFVNASSYVDNITYTHAFPMFHRAYFL